MLILHMKQMVPKWSENSAKFPIVCMNWNFEFNRLPCAWARCTMMLFSMFHSDINWPMFEVCVLIGLSRLLDTHIANKYLYKTSPLINDLMRETISQSGLQWTASLDGDNSYMDGRREWEDIGISREILRFIYIYIYIILLTYLYSYSITYIIP